MGIKSNQNYLNLKKSYIYEDSEILESPCVDEYFKKVCEYFKGNMRITLICKYKQDNKTKVTHDTIDIQTDNQPTDRIYHFIWGCIQLFLTNENDIQFIYY